MWTYNYTNCELYHHGVKGMKWGQRRAERKAARAERKAQLLRGKNLRKQKKLNPDMKMTNEEMNDLNAYNKRRTGKIIATAIIAGVAATSVHTFIQNKGMQQIKLGIEMGKAFSYSNW